MNDNKVTQSDNKIAGDQAGRDINKPTYSFPKSQEAIEYMSRLLRRFKEEQDRDIRLNQLIEELDYYNCPFKGDVLGLEEKLKDANRESFIDFALRAKERFHKKLVKYQFFESAQRINVYLLAMVESYFENYIYPKIHNDVSAEEIKILIQERLVNPLLDQLAENTLDFNAVDINGMIYFLTGNCHIKWTK